jgi:hypothetical protein
MSRVILFLLFVGMLSNMSAAVHAGGGNSHLPRRHRHFSAAATRVLPAGSTIGSFDDREDLPQRQRTARRPAFQCARPQARDAASVDIFWNPEPSSANMSAQRDVVNCGGRRRHDKNGQEIL